MNLWLCFRIEIHVVSLIYIVFICLCEMFLAFIAFYSQKKINFRTITENSFKCMSLLSGGCCAGSCRAHPSDNS